METRTRKVLRDHAVAFAAGALIVGLALAFVGCGGEMPDAEPAAVVAVASPLVGTWSTINPSPPRSWSFTSSGTFTYAITGHPDLTGAYTLDAAAGTITIQDGSRDGQTFPAQVVTCGPGNPRPSASITDCAILASISYWRAQ